MKSFPILFPLSAPLLLSIGSGAELLYEFVDRVFGVHTGHRSRIKFSQNFESKMRIVSRHYESQSLHKFRPDFHKPP
jgi:hypothetical protein